jgi:serine/threonine-protein kinase RsbW
MGSGDGALVLSTPAVPTAVGDMRRRVVAHLHHAGVPGDLIEAVQIAVSEAVSNAVIHAYHAVSHTGTVAIELRIAHPAVHLTITDEGTGMVPRRDSPGAGLGLGIIANLATSVDITRGADGRGTRLHLCFTPADSVR